jgi:hypothetical protein
MCKKEALDEVLAILNREHAKAVAAHNLAEGVEVQELADVAFGGVLKERALLDAARAKPEPGRGRGRHNYY